jgi:hemerythrin
MKDEYRTGIDMIDKEHEKLFEITNRAYETLVDDFIPDKYDYIVDIITELKEYSITHFQHEEEYMASLNYKKLFSHKAMHAEFIEKVEEYDFVNLDENQKDVIFGILEFLNDWLVHHIIENDKLIS